MLQALVSQEPGARFGQFGSPVNTGKRRLIRAPIPHFSGCGGQVLKKWSQVFRFLRVLPTDDGGQVWPRLDGEFSGSLVDWSWGVWPGTGASFGHFWISGGYWKTEPVSGPDWRFFRNWEPGIVKTGPGFCKSKNFSDGRMGPDMARLGRAVR